MKRIVTILFAIVAITAQAQTGIPQQYIGLWLPMICITTADGQEPTSEGIMHPEGSYVGAGITNVVPKEARMQIYRADTLWYDSGEYLKDESGIKIKHRGNTSAYYFDNKPFKLSLQKKADLIIAEEGDTVNRKSKDWVLLNNAECLRAMIANRMARLIGMEYAYDFSFYASRIGLADNCETQFKLVGKDSLMVTLDASGNVDKTVLSRICSQTMTASLHLKSLPGQVTAIPTSFTTSMPFAFLPISQITQI